MAGLVSAPVLMTGATGLLGTWVVRRWPADAPDLIPVGSADADLLAPGGPARLVDRLRPGAVVHLAWSASGTDGYRHAAENALWVDATTSLLEASIHHGAETWLTGTVVDEPLRPTEGDAYTRSKAILRVMVADHIEAGCIGWLKPFYLFDPEAGRPALVADALEAAAKDEPLELRTPNSRHDFVHASDAADAVVLAVLNHCRGVLPVGSGRSRSVGAVARALGVRTYTRGAPEPGPLPSHSEEAPADVSWLDALGWAPTRTEEFFRDE